MPPGAVQLGAQKWQIMLNACTFSPILRKICQFLENLLENQSLLEGFRIGGGFFSQGGGRHYRVRGR